ncbi:hypothetical protein SLT36_30080 (plasmid) [Aminobacter sp. BA135]|uniref:hypothetical protein n=1 Tax=Aminobacter sp. BA135 TaxID=537596 RepID=UPI003D7A09FB
MRNTLDLPGTLEDLSGELGLSGGEIFSSNLQDRMAFHLLKRRGYQRFMSGKLSRTAFGRALAQEWASFPVLGPTKGAKRKLKRGQSFYAGDGLNKSLVKPETVEALLDRMKKAGNVSPASAESAAEPVIVEPVVVEKPVVADPGELEQHPMKSKTVWQWIITTVIVPLLVVFQDWRVQLAIVVIIAAFAA